MSVRREFKHTHTHTHTHTHRECCKAVEGVVQALHSFKSFIDELGWPEKSFASQLEVKVAAICAQRFHEAATE